MSRQELEAEEGDESILGEDGTCVPLGSSSGNVWLVCSVKVGC